MHPNDFDVPDGVQQCVTIKKFNSKMSKHIVHELAQTWVQTLMVPLTDHSDPLISFSLA